MTIYKSKDTSNKNRLVNDARRPNKTDGLNLQDNRDGNVAQGKFAPANPPRDVAVQLNEKGSLVDNRSVQRKKNDTGLPDQLKAGVENLSGQSLDDVNVHYNSAKPGELQAHAFAQGNQIHVAPGQEKHLPHEAWHVAQQKQGRVRPTTQLKAGITINDNRGLEREADMMGAKATQLKSNSNFSFTTAYSQTNYPLQSPVVQRSIIVSGGQMAKGPRHPFLSDINKYLQIGSNEARCHYIPFGYIRLIVMNQINAGLSGTQGAVVMGDLEYLINAIFPNGRAADNHKSDTNYGALTKIAHTLYDEAQNCKQQIGTIIDNSKNLGKLAELGTNLIDALNNSPDNLRPGNSNTNSSISDSLDFPATHVAKGILPKGTTIVDKHYKPSYNLTSNMEVLLPNEAATTIILNLIDSAHIGFEAVVYSSDYILQSSDHKMMKTATMSDKIKVPVALELDTGWYLFETN
ncbi:DUF4157 domain-containing protein [Mucilaginibacter jinjuensis]|uniref:DUF4157 domain-containing protein n=1 Tax=Mucilaginibacter jinjuensis TaxID=1176721 RepID=A0ABY7T802_9SPHI|nr:DUF4157 domain-containing protein [Mucilaginibacter jinjuensis]WCT12482.1 DUF4157 domain-containing protein [Mucilaginibacter jinjuensis]